MKQGCLFFILAVPWELWQRVKENITLEFLGITATILFVAGIAYFMLR